MTIDGTTVRVQGNGTPLTDADVDALREIVEAVRRMPPDPEREARYTAARARIRARNERLGLTS